MMATQRRPPVGTLGALVAARARTDPDDAAVRTAGGSAVTWAAVADESARGSQGLTAAGLRPGDRVAVALDQPDRWLTVALAVIGAGGVVVPVPASTAGADRVARCARVHWAVTDDVALAARLAPEVTIVAEGDARGDRRWAHLLDGSGSAAPSGPVASPPRAPVVALLQGAEVVEVDHDRLVAAADTLHAGLGRPAPGTPVVSVVDRSSPVGLAAALTWPVLGQVVPVGGTPLGPMADAIAVLDARAAMALADAVRSLAAADRIVRRRLTAGRVLAAGRWRGDLGPGTTRAGGIGRADVVRDAVLERRHGARLRDWLGWGAVRAVVIVDEVDPAALRDLVAVGLPVRRAASHPAVAGLVALAPPDAAVLATCGPVAPGLAVRATIGGVIEARGPATGSDGWVPLAGFGATIGRDGAIRLRLGRAR